MRRYHLIPLLAMVLAGPAFASEECTAPQDQRRPVEELKADLEGKG